MGLISFIASKFGRISTDLRHYEAQFGGAGHEVRTNADPNSGTTQRYGYFLVLEEAVMEYRDLLSGDTHTGTFPAGDWVVGLMDSFEITSGKIRVYRTTI